MTLRDILNKLLRRQEASANTARERLQLVLAHDRTDLSPDLLDQMRREIDGDRLAGGVTKFLLDLRHVTMAAHPIGVNPFADLSEQIGFLSPAPCAGDTRLGVNNDVALLDQTLAEHRHQRQQR